MSCCNEKPVACAAAHMRDIRPPPSEDHRTFFRHTYAFPRRCSNLPEVVKRWFDRRRSTFSRSTFRTRNSARV